MKAAGVRGLRRVLAAMRPGPEAQAALPQELQAWRLLADREAARGRVWLKEGRVWDAGVSTGRALAYREAAAGVEAVPELRWGGGRGW